MQAETDTGGIKDAAENRRKQRVMYPYMLNEHNGHKVRQKAGQKNRKARKDAETPSDKPEADKGGDRVQQKQDGTERYADIRVTSAVFLKQQGKAGKAAGKKAAGVDKGVEVKSHDDRTGGDKGKAFQIIVCVRFFVHIL
ncbi:hypothetical protein FACS1894161_2920 [Spirochaetia bacterium]|nr:hypothetical protein FACS1894161_2920 [Spirochaetia bacterium]